MNAKKALKKIDEHRRKGWEEAWPGFLDVVEIALREKVEREEKERPKVTLAEQIEAVAWCSRAHPSSQRNAGKPPIGVTLHHAAATLRRLEEEGGKLLNWHFDKIGHDTTREEWVLLLRSLGVEARKP